MTDSRYIATGVSYEAFEHAAEAALADFLTAAYAGTGGPLHGVRILAGLRDYEITADAADTQFPPTRTEEAAKLAAALRQRVTIVCNDYQREEPGTDIAALRVKVVTNLQIAHRADHARLVNLLRTYLSPGYQEILVREFNSWAAANAPHVLIDGISTPDGMRSTYGFDESHVVTDIYAQLRGALT